MTSHLIAILPLNPYLIATPIVKLHHNRNLHRCHLVVTNDSSKINLALEVQVGLMVQAFGSYCSEM